MNEEEIRIKLFHLDKAINKQRKDDIQQAKDNKLPRIYHLTPDNIESKYISSNNIDKNAVHIKKAVKRTI